MAKENKPKREKKVRYTRKGKPIKHPVLRIIGIILAVLLAVILLVVVAGFVSCKTSFTSEGVSGSDLALPEPTASEQVISKFEDNGGELYQSIDVMGQIQSTESFESGPAAAGGSYDGTDVAQIEEGFCLTCHTQVVLDGYSADADSARQKVESMRDDYGCALTDEQVDALVDHYTQ